MCRLLYGLWLSTHLDKYLGGWWLDWMVRIYLALYDTTKLSSKVAVNESFCFLTFSSAFAAVSILAFGHSDTFLVALKSDFKKRVSLEIKPPYDPAIPLLGIYPEETKIEKDTCISLFIAALFTIARTWKQPRCPLTDEWIKRLWYIYTMEY